MRVLNVAPFSVDAGVEGGVGRKGKRGPESETAGYYRELMAGRYPWEGQ